MTSSELDALADGAVLAGPDGRVTAINAVAARLLGADDAVGKHLNDVLALQDHTGCAWFDANAPYDGLPTRTAIPEQAWLLPDGTEVLTVARILRPARDAGSQSGARGPAETFPPSATRRTNASAFPRESTAREPAERSHEQRRDEAG